MRKNYFRRKRFVNMLAWSKEWETCKTWWKETNLCGSGLHWRIILRCKAVERNVWNDEHIDKAITLTTTMLLDTKHIYTYINSQLLSADQRAYVSWSEQNNATFERALITENIYCNFFQSPPFCAYIMYLQQYTVLILPLFLLLPLFLILSVPINNLKY